MANRSSSLLIAVEGIDGAGKTTQVKMLRESLERAGEVPVVSKEPTNGPWGPRRTPKTGHQWTPERVFRTFGGGFTESAGIGNRKSTHDRENPGRNHERHKSATPTFRQSAGGIPGFAHKQKGRHLSAFPRTPAS